MLVFSTFTLLIISTFSSTVLAEFDPSSSLRMVIVLFRHGARSPLVTFPTDPNRMHPWVGGYEALQPKGIEEVFELGRSLRQRYQALLPKDGLYSRENMKIVSSVEERCIMSAQGLLAALLEPPEGAINITIRWQPAAVNVLTEDEDNILLQTKKCTKADRALESLETTAGYVEWKKQVQKQMTYISQHAERSINSILDLIKFYDAIIVANYFGLAVPDWMEALYPDEAIEFYKTFLLTFTATPELKRLRGGIILTEFLSHMKAKRDGTLKPDRSIFIYSGHDRTQVSMLDSMGMINQTTTKPAFASAVAFELHYNPAVRDDLEVRMVYYADESVTTPRQLEIPECSSPCHLRKLESNTRSLYVEDFEEACSSAKLWNVSRCVLLCISIIYIYFGI